MGSPSSPRKGAIIAIVGAPEKHITGRWLHSFRRPRAYSDASRDLPGATRPALDTLVVPDVLVSDIHSPGIAKTPFARSSTKSRIKPAHGAENSLPRCQSCWWNEGRKRWTR